MVVALLLVALVLVLCVFSDKLSGRIGVPALLIFICLGMFFGCDGLVKIPFDNYSFSEHVCEAALIVIMFTGGFSVNLKSAKPAALKACLMSTLGVAVTAGVTALFCYFALGFGAAESFLMGAVISSTDAASVFSVLRSKKLNLKNGLAPLLEIESGSNDPFSYMLTVLALAVSTGGITAGGVSLMVLEQLGLGVLFGVGVGFVGVYISTRFSASSEGFACIMYLAAALFAYGLPVLMGGNGYLSVYIAGIILGNLELPDFIKIPHRDRAREKKQRGETVVFLNGITGLCQIAVFFLLGLLATPSRFAESAVSALLIYLCLTLLSRPLAVLLFCGKSSVKERLFISLSGLRGASSIVFAIMAVVRGNNTEHEIFNIVFMICLLSMLVQGSLLPFAAKKLALIDDSADVLRTFNDYVSESAVSVIRFFISDNHPWAGKPLSEITFPDGARAVMIKRGEETIIPRGNTVIAPRDSVMLSVPACADGNELRLREVLVDSRHEWCGKKIKELSLPNNLLIVLIRRGEESLIPEGSTEICEDDTVVVTEQ